METKGHILINLSKRAQGKINFGLLWREEAIVTLRWGTSEARRETVSWQQWESVFTEKKEDKLRATDTLFKTTRVNNYSRQTGKQLGPWKCYHQGIRSGMGQGAVCGGVEGRKWCHREALGQCDHGVKCSLIKWESEERLAGLGGGCWCWRGALGGACGPFWGGTRYRHAFKTLVTKDKSEIRQNTEGTIVMWKLASSLD